MTLDEELTEVFDRAVREGVSSLSPAERELYLIQDFIIEYEMNGLSGYFYNRLPDLQAIRATIASMQSHGLTGLAGFLAEATELFRTYEEPNPPSTWQEVLCQYDPSNQMNRISDQIRALDGYGLPGAGSA